MCGLFPVAARLQYHARGLAVLAMLSLLKAHSDLSTAVWRRSSTNRGSPRPATAALGRNRGVEQGYGRGLHCLGRSPAILVHSRGDGGAVVKEEELPAHLLGGGGAGFSSKIGEQGPEPGAIFFGNNCARIAGLRLRGGADEPAATKCRPCQQIFNFAKHGEESLSRRLVGGQNARDAGLPPAEGGFVVGADDVARA